MMYGQFMGPGGGGMLSIYKTFSEDTVGKQMEYGFSCVVPEEDFREQRHD